MGERILGRGNPRGFQWKTSGVLFCFEKFLPYNSFGCLILLSQGKSLPFPCKERNLYGHSVRLDALCILGNGEKCNIEVQRSDNDDHLKRVRFNASSITVKESQVNDKFQDVAEVYVVYISEFDIFEKGRTIYHVENVIQETGDRVDDGLHRIFVNTACDDGTDIADLMSCFKEKQVNNPKFPIFTRRMNELKNEEGGLNIMCEVMLKYEKIAAKKERIEAIQNMIDLGLSEDKILTKYSKEEYEEAKQGLLVEV